jgi:hypothetical protein
MAKKINNSTGFNGFSVVTQGWPGGGWKAQFNEITARFVDHPDRGNEAQIQYQITQHYEARSQTMYGSISLAEDQAIEMAKQMVPQYVADAIDAAVKAKS